jgi:asparagine synthase (glutamine-hydrolysing)
VLAGYSWYPPLSGVPRDRALDAYAREFFDRPHGELNRQLGPAWRLDRDVSREFVAEHFARPGARTAVDAALRLDTEVMLVDDPVKRVDNMTMAWGLEARVPFLDHELVELAAACPPELKLAQGGKGVLKDAARGIVPDEVIDRPKGYFPVPGIRHLEGALLDRVADALHAPAARARGLFDQGYVDRLLADPNTPRTTLGANQLWQLALLEMWLQDKGV